MKIKNSIPSSLLTESSLIEDKSLKNTNINNIICKSNIMTENIFIKRADSIFSIPKVNKRKILFYKKTPSSIKIFTYKNTLDYCNYEDKSNIKNNLFKNENENESESKKNNIIYKKKSVKKSKKINVHFHKRNFSMNYFININTNLKNNDINSLAKSYINGNKTQMRIKSKIKKNSTGMNITKAIILNKKEEIGKIIYIQRIWKRIMNNKQKIIMDEYKQLLNYIPCSFYFSRKFKSNSILNNSNTLSNINSIMSYSYNKNDTFKENYNSTFINSNIKLDKNINESKNKKGDIKKKKSKTNRNSNNSSKIFYNNCNYSNTYNNSKNINNYSINASTSLKIKRHMNYSNIKKRKNSNKKIKIKNKLNIWIKYKIKFNFNLHNIDKYKNLIPNKNFIKIDSLEKEENLFTNNIKKDIIPKPDISLMKKIKKNTKKKSKPKLLAKKEKIIVHYFLNNENDIEPPLYIENKLIMKKPIFTKSIQ